MIPISNIMMNSPFVSNSAPYAQQQAQTPASVGASGISGLPNAKGVQLGVNYPTGKEQAEDPKNSVSALRKFDRNECQTCKNRRYQDVSDDSGVSFQTPTKLSPGQAASAVRSHEGEHVVRERAKASREGREVVSQTVTYQMGICPECGKAYVAGGTTRTVTKGPSSYYNASGQPSSFGQDAQKGANLDLTA